MAIRNHPDPADASTTMAILVRATCAMLLWCVASNAHAASIYQCTGSHGGTTFRDTPCATQARQTKLDVAGQPLIDPNAPRLAAPARTTKAATTRTREHRAAVATRGRKPKPATSWECHAADGEVFYRHTRCPGSVPGDGTVRSDYAETTSRSRSGKRHNAWSKVPVHGEKVSRSEACRRIRSPSAAGRDGHLRDETVDTYARLTGRDPCSGA